MHPRRAFFILLLASVPVLLCGCAAVVATLRPDHLTLYAERNEADSLYNGRRTSTTGHKEAVSITYDLDKR